MVQRYDTSNGDVEMLSMISNRAQETQGIEWIMENPQCPAMLIYTQDFIKFNSFKRPRQQLRKAKKDTQSAIPFLDRGEVL